MFEFRDWWNRPTWPDVDVIMPILNEAAHLPRAPTASRAQANLGIGARVFMAISSSNDETGVVGAALAAVDPDLVIVGNSTGKTPAALNLAIGYVAVLIGSTLSTTQAGGLAATRLCSGPTLFTSVLRPLRATRGKIRDPTLDSGQLMHLATPLSVAAPSQGY